MPGGSVSVADFLDGTAVVERACNDGVSVRLFPGPPPWSQVKGSGRSRGVAVAVVVAGRPDGSSGESKIGEGGRVDRFRFSPRISQKDNTRQAGPDRTCVKGRQEAAENKVGWLAEKDSEFQVRFSQGFGGQGSGSAASVPGVGRGPRQKAARRIS